MAKPGMTRQGTPATTTTTAYTQPGYLTFSDLGNSSWGESSSDQLHVQPVGPPVGQTPLPCGSPPGPYGGGEGHSRLPTPTGSKTPAAPPRQPPAHIGRVPDAVHQLLVDLDHEEEQEDDQHEQRADHSPRDLPEDVGLVADHELDVPVEPGHRGGKEAVTGGRRQVCGPVKAEGGQPVQPRQTSPSAVPQPGLSLTRDPLPAEEPRSCIRRRLGRPAGPSVAPWCHRPAPQPVNLLYGLMRSWGPCFWARG